MYRILIVEDDRGIADAIKTQAEMWDLQIRCVQNFRNVLEEFSVFDPHLVLSNALKYTPAGSITITLENEKTFRIRDTGIGIATEDIPRIFENGYTGFNGRTDKKASGIGLYLCKRICNNLGHTITARSIVDVERLLILTLHRQN